MNIASVGRFFGEAVQCSRRSSFQERNPVADVGILVHVLASGA